MVISIIADSDIDGTALEHILHEVYEDKKIAGNAGHKWFDLNEHILNVDIKELLKDLEGLNYKLLSTEEINAELEIYNRSVQPTVPPNINLYELLWSKSITLYDYQNECFKKAIEKYLTNDKLILNWTCGLGKTIMSLKISSYYVSTRLLIAVPSTLLLKQWLTNISRIGYYKRYRMLIICSDRESVYSSLPNAHDSYCITTNPEKIRDFIGKNRKCVVITMYQSSHILKKLFLDGKLKKEFEFSILDECHHLCKWLDNKSDRQNTDVLDIPYKKRLGLTATMKKLTNENSVDNYDETNDEVISEKIKVLDEEEEHTTIWCLEPECVESYEPFIDEEALDTHMGQVHGCYEFLP